jgi:hypothetical protein
MKIGEEYRFTELQLAKVGISVVDGNHSYD